MISHVDAVKNLVGDDNAKRGAVKMFEASQEQRLNRHLFYVSFLSQQAHL